jgi:acetyltransferase-like isoleucine patch superfamily enzyme
VFKRLIEAFVRKSKNKDFRFDVALSSSVLAAFLCTKIAGLIRSLKFYHIGRRGKFLFLGRKVCFFNKKNIVLGNNVNLGDFVKLSAMGQGGLELGENVSIGSFSQIVISTSFNNIGQSIKIEDNVGIGEFSYIGGGGGVLIGRDTIVGQYFSMHPENHVYADKSELIRLQGVTRKGIKIGRNCWLGSKVTILDGVSIGDGCVVAAGSVVISSFGDNAVIGGVPAKVLR